MIQRKKSTKKKLTLKKALQQIDVMAAAIVRFLDWQENKMRLKHEQRIRRMIDRQLRLRMNRKRSLSD